MTSVLSATIVQERLSGRLDNRVTFLIGPRVQDLTACLQQKGDLLDAVGELINNLGMGLATIVATDERREADGDFKVRYIFEPVSAPYGPLADLFATLVVSLDAAQPVVPSITPLVPAANWHEREMRDMFGINPQGHPDP